MKFYYVDDVIESFVAQLEGGVSAREYGIYYLDDDCVYTVTVGELADLITAFGDGKRPEVENEFENRLYYTYESYGE